MKRKGRPINGVLLLDKPINISSNHALQKCKRLFNANKAGHTGSLDPLATGMLPICFGRATKFSAYLLDADKHYQVTAKLGMTTATGDLEGEVLSEKPVPTLSAQDIETVLSNFRGDIKQVPPMYSALKHQGKPLYALARAGKTVERPPRPITIYELQCVDYKAPYLTLTVHCSKGTYIRTLAEDIGAQLGCGACVSALHRTSVAHFTQDKMLSMATLEQIATDEDLQSLDQYLMPIEAMMAVWPKCSVSASQAFILKNGRPIATELEQVGLVRVYLEGGEFLGLCEADSGQLKPVKFL